MLDNLIGSTEAITLLGIDRSTLSRWVTHHHTLTPVFKLPGRSGAYLFLRSDIEQLAEDKHMQENLMQQLANAVTRWNNRVAHNLDDTSDAGRDLAAAATALLKWEETQK